MYGDLCTIAMSNTKLHILPTNATNNNLIASNYNSKQMAIEWRLLDKNIKTLTTTVAKKETQQTNYFASGWHVIGVSNTLFALAYFVPSLASADCETCLEILVEEQIVDELIRVRVSHV
jgi:hypothetical protein